jgi:hypothetical protein
MTANAARGVVFAAAVAIAGHACTPAQNGGPENAGPPSAVVSSDSRVSMERLPCFGTCPVYRVAIAADGAVTFAGERYVDTIGTASHRIEPGEAAALMHALVDGGFFDLADDYTQGAKECGMYHTDAPRVNLTVRVDGRSKTVQHDYGCGGAPPSLRSLQERVDSVAGVSRWVGGR